MGRKLRQKDFAGPAEEVARALIGARFFLNGVGGILVELEAYDQREPGSHCFPGETPRTRAMFGPPGCAYVYLSYGMHVCMNFVCGANGHGCGVLIRAIQPTRGLATMRARRGMTDERLLCAGPGRVGQALGITLEHYGLPLYKGPFSLYAPDDPSRIHIVSGPRIGVKKAPEYLWRFGLAGSRYLSRKF